MIRPKKIAAIAATTLGVLLVLLLVLPLFFGDRIEAGVRDALGRNLDADISWESARLGLLRNFPHATLRLAQPAVVGAGAFAGDTLIAADRLAITLDLGSVVRAMRGNGALVVRSVTLDRPDASVVVLEDGTASWDIIREQPAAATDQGRAVDVSLQSLSVRDGRVRYDDRQAGLLARLSGLDHDLSGDFTSERFSIAADVQVDSTSVAFAGIPYLRNVDLALNTVLDVDRSTQRVTVADGGIRLNQLVVTMAGAVAGTGDELQLDLTFRTPGTAFADILSLVPVIYANDFAAIQASGTMQVDGFVLGAWGPDAFPAFALNATVRQGRFRYPDLPLPAREIGADLAITNPGGDADSTVIALERFHVVIGSEPIDAAFTVRTPVSDPQIDLRASGRLSLDDLARTMKMPDVERLAGTVSGDIDVSTRYSAIDAGDYERVQASGTIEASGIALHSAALPQEISVEEAHLALSPRHAELTSFHGTFGSSDVAASGRLENMLGFLLRDQDLRGSATVSSRRFDLNEWRTEREELEIIPVPPRVDFMIDAVAAEVTFGPVAYTNARGRLHVRDQRITLDEFRMDMLGGSAVATGWYETVQPDQPGFNVQMQLADVDIASAFASLNTVRALAPIAEYAQGRVSADVQLNGAMNPDMTPLWDVLTGLGSFETSSLVISDFPALTALGDRLKVDALRQPALRAIASTFEVRNGRLHVQPFDVGIGDMRLHVQGSNGIDRSLDYDLQLDVPRSLLGTGAEPVLAGLSADAARLGIDLDNVQQLALGVKLGGTVDDPAITTQLATAAGGVTAGVEQALRDAAAERRDEASAYLDSVGAEARARADARAAELTAAARERAEQIRVEAQTLAERVRAEGYAHADSLVARASSPAASVAARAAAETLRREADEAADRIIVEADARAAAVAGGQEERSDTTQG